MEVFMMIGRYAGEIRDIAPHYAHGMIERGEAIDPNAPIVPAVELAAPSPMVQEVQLMPVERIKAAKPERRRNAS